ncbi:cytochrome P450 CYP72A219-like [Silene latifolia]|uniref:cytochrome P450 CYP72A219-like n=1 Tax=Silene latifolia TaxID=37657 RepID=UPI003D785C04
MEALSSALISPIAISLACILAVTFSWRVLKWVWFNPKRLERILREQGFQGNPYKLLYGDSKDKARMTAEARSKPMSDLSNDHLPRTQPFYHHTVKNHGKRCIMWDGPTPMVNITEPEAIREIFTKINEFQKPQINPILNVVATGLIQLEGDMWAKHRKLLNPAFHMEKLKFMLPAFSASTSEMINTWEEMVSETGSCEIDVWSHLHKLSADVISRAAFGSSYEEGRRIFELITEQLKVAVPIINQVYIPGWRYVPTKVNRRIMELDREIKSLLKEIIKKRENAIKAGAKPKDDLLGVLLESNANKNHKISISLEEVIDECKIFFLAGQETTSTLLAWTLILLGKHQDWQQRAREEVLNAFGDNTPDFHGLNQLKMVNMILQEVLRLYPPVQELTRTVCKDIKVGDIFLPAGVLVNLPLLHVQHDESIWGSDAKEFKPDRFSQGMSKATNGKTSFFSFGWGPRICIGSNFAMTEARLVLVMILQRFSFEISPSYAHAPAAISTLQPQFGAPIILKQLSH